MGDRLSIVVPCALRCRDAVGALIQQVCQRLEANGARAGTGYQVLSAFNEAFNNLAKHAYPAGEGEVEIELQILPDRLVLELRDSGEPFDFGEVEQPDLDALPERGLGVYIIRSFMNEVDYRTAGDHNVLRMVRHLSASGDPPAQGTTEDA